MNRPQSFFGVTTSHYDASAFRLLELNLNQGSAAPSHCHERSHFCFVLKGCYDEKIGRRSFAREPLDLMFHPAGVAHSGNNLTGIHCLVVEVSENLISRINEERNSPLLQPRYFRQSELNELASRLYYEWMQPQVCCDLAIESIVLEMLVFLARQDVVVTSPSAPPWLTELLEILKADFLESPTLAKLATTLARNPSHMARVFRLHTGMSIGEYVRFLKVEMARMQLDESDEPLFRIARNCGFRDQAHFSNVFRKVTGKSPRQYRLEHLV